MQTTGMLHDARLRVGALIGTSFLLGSTGWLAWLYRITPLANPAQVDFFTMVVGYLVQAMGIGAYMLARHKLRAQAVAMSVIVALIAYVVLLEPAVTANSLIALLAAGYAMNLACGWFQGHYLCCLAQLVNPHQRGTAFGAGYAASTLVTWALSSFAGGALVEGLACLAVCGALALVCILLVRLVAALPAIEDAAREADAQARSTSVTETPVEEGAPYEVQDGSSARGTSPTRTVLVLAAAAVVVVSLVKNAGFSFPTADLSGTVNLELSRLFYGMGLLIAGIVADRDRRLAFGLCAISLVMPFLMLALAGAHASSVALWALGYLLFGFFTVWRTTLFADLAANGGGIWLAGAGLALGRVGDALGTALCLSLADAPIALVAATGVLFVVAAALLVPLYRQLYLLAGSAPEQPAHHERDLQAQFIARNGLSLREREVLELLVTGKTNAEIAGMLFVTESTVKFHVRNILKKSGLTNRREIIEACTPNSNR